MAVAHAQRLLLAAQNGERKLATQERRHVIEWLDVTQRGENTTEQIAEWFQVSDRTIYADRKAIRLRKAKILKEDDPGLIIADIQIAFEQQMTNLEKGLAACTVGSKNHLAYSSAIMELHFKKLKAFQDAGYTPKNLGNMTIEKFSYQAFVSKDGSVDTRRVDLYKKGDFVEGDVVVPAPQLTAGSNEQNGTSKTELPAVTITCEPDQKQAGNAAPSSGPS